MAMANMQREHGEAAAEGGHGKAKSGHDQPAAGHAAKQPHPATLKPAASGHAKPAAHEQLNQQPSPRMVLNQVALGMERLKKPSLQGTNWAGTLGKPGSHRRQTVDAIVNVFHS